MIRRAFNPRSTRNATVGTGDYVFASHLIRLRTAPDLADPDYVAFVLNSAIGRQPADMLSGQIAGQANINSEEPRSIELPAPTLDIQRELATKAAAQRQRIAALTAEADRKTEQTKTDVEAMILGEKKLKT